jgi:hypothetical protein
MPICNGVAKHISAQFDPEDDTTYCVCSKRCYNKVKTALTNNTYFSPNDNSRLGWENDGQNGPDDINNSMKLLLDWMGENGAINYTRFRGKNNILSKNNTAELVARRINSYGVKIKRTAKSALNKLYYLEKSFRTAHDFANSETGAGLLATDNGSTFQKLIEKRCMYYEELLPIFQGRASARATITSNNLDGDTEDEEDKCEDDIEEENIDPNIVPTKNIEDESTVATAALLATIRSEIPGQKRLDDKSGNNKNGSKNRPISVANTNSSNKKPKNIPYDYAMSDYGQKKEDLALKAAEEVRRHNHAMEEIAHSSADIEKTKKNIQMGAIAKSAQLDNEKKSLEFRI